MALSFESIPCYLDLYLLLTMSGGMALAAYTHLHYTLKSVNKPLSKTVPKLHQILSSEFGLLCFMQFLVSELSMENLEFFTLSMRWRHRLARIQVRRKKKAQQKRRENRLMREQQNRANHSKLQKMMAEDDPKTINQSMAARGRSQSAFARLKSSNGPTSTDNSAAPKRRHSIKDISVAVLNKVTKPMVASAAAHNVTMLHHSISTPPIAQINEESAAPITNMPTLHHGKSSSNSSVRSNRRRKRRKKRVKQIGFASDREFESEDGGTPLALTTSLSLNIDSSLATPVANTKKTVVIVTTPALDSGTTLAPRDNFDVTFHTHKSAVNKHVMMRSSPDMALTMPALQEDKSFSDRTHQLSISIPNDEPRSAEYGVSADRLMALATADFSLANRLSVTIENVPSLVDNHDHIITPYGMSARPSINLNQVDKPHLDMLASSDSFSMKESLVPVVSQNRLSMLNLQPQPSNPRISASMTELSVTCSYFTDDELTATTDGIPGWTRPSIQDEPYPLLTFSFMDHSNHPTNPDSGSNTVSHPQSSVVSVTPPLQQIYTGGGAPPTFLSQPRVSRISNVAAPPVFIVIGGEPDPPPGLVSLPATGIYLGGDSDDSDAAEKDNNRESSTPPDTPIAGGVKATMARSRADTSRSPHHSGGRMRPMVEFESRKNVGMDATMMLSHSGDSSFGDNPSTIGLASRVSLNIKQLSARFSSRSERSRHSSEADESATPLASAVAPISGSDMMAMTLANMRNQTDDVTIDESKEIIDETDEDAGFHFVDDDLSTDSDMDTNPTIVKTKSEQPQGLKLHQTKKYASAPTIVMNGGVTDTIDTDDTDLPNNTKLPTYCTDGSNDNISDIEMVVVPPISDVQNASSKTPVPQSISKPKRSDRVTQSSIIPRVVVQQAIDIPNDKLPHTPPILSLQPSADTFLSVKKANTAQHTKRASMISFFAEQFEKNILEELRDEMDAIHSGSHHHSAHTKKPKSRHGHLAVAGTSATANSDSDIFNATADTIHSKPPMSRLVPPGTARDHVRSSSGLARVGAVLKTIFAPTVVPMRVAVCESQDSSGISAPHSHFPQNSVDTFTLPEGTECVEPIAPPKKEDETADAMIVITYNDDGVDKKKGTKPESIVYNDGTTTVMSATQETMSTANIPSIAGTTTVTDVTDDIEKNNANCIPLQWTNGFVMGADENAPALPTEGQLLERLRSKSAGHGLPPKSKMGTDTSVPLKPVSQKDAFDTSTFTLRNAAWVQEEFLRTKKVDFGRLVDMIENEININYDARRMCLEFFEKYDTVDKFVKAKLKDYDAVMRSVWRDVWQNLGDSLSRFPYSVEYTNYLSQQSSV